MKKAESHKNIRDIKNNNGKQKNIKSSILKKRITKSKSTKSGEVDVRPYREIVFSDGHGFYIKTTCNLTSDDRVQVTQYREHIDHDGTKFVCGEPAYFENKDTFLEWLLEMLKGNFDEIPYITITPIETSKIKKHEREATDAMYL